MLDSEFAARLNTSKSNSFAVLADAFSRGVFKDEGHKPRELQGPKKSLEKLRNSSSQPFDTRGKYAFSLLAK